MFNWYCLNNSKMPPLNEDVICNIMRIEIKNTEGKEGVYVTLPEWGNKRAFMPLINISRGLKKLRKRLKILQSHMKNKIPIIGRVFNNESYIILSLPDLTDEQHATIHSKYNDRKTLLKIIVRRAY